MTGKVAWKEGLALLPQHFQRAEETWREDLHSHFGHPPSRGFGFSRLNLDQTQLASAGLFRIETCAGMFPGGHRFDSEHGQTLALHRQVPNGLGMEIQRITVYLAMKAPSDGAANLGPEAAFGEYGTQLPDATTGRSRREVVLCSPNLSVRFSTDANDGFLLLPVCSLLRGDQGQATVAADFLPTLLDVNAWEPLSLMVQKLSGIIQMRCRTLEQQNPAVDTQGMRQWLECLHLRAHQPLLDQAASTLETHPAELFKTLLSLSGGLVFTRAMSISSAAYKHSEMSACLLGLLNGLFSALAAEIRTDNLVKAMNREAPVLFSLQLPRENWKAGKKFFLAIRTSLTPDQLVVHFGQHAKAAARSKLQAIITSALPGVESRLSPPPAFFRATGQHCFELSPTGAMWQTVMDEGFLGVYTPANLDVTSIELLIEGG